jgi:hypothetical protein
MNTIPTTRKRFFPKLTLICAARLTSRCIR